MTGKLSSMRIEFATRHELSVHIRELLGQRIQPQLADELASSDAVAESFSTIAMTAGGQSRFDGGFGVLTPKFAAENFDVRWAIRDGDLDLLEQLVNGVTSGSSIGAITYLYGGAQLAPAAFCGAIGAGLLFFRKLKKKRASLTVLEYEILRGLKSSPNGMSLDQLEGWVAWSRVEATQQELVATLERLGAFRLPDGSVEKLVHRDASSRWSAPV